MRAGQKGVRVSSSLFQALAGRRLTKRLAALAGVLLVSILFYALARLDGIVTKSDLIEFIAAVITALSFAITFALAVLAINAFSNFREIEAFKTVAEGLRADLAERAEKVDAMLAMLPWVIEAISARIGELSPADVGPRDVNYFRILHGRLFMKLLMATDGMIKIDICRDIVGSMSVEDSEEILTETMRALEVLRDDRPQDRDLIDPLLGTGKALMAEHRLAAARLRAA